MIRIGAAVELIRMILSIFNGILTYTHTHACDLFELYKWRRHNQRRERTSLDPKKHHRTWLESCSVRVLQRQTNELVNFQLGCYYSSRLYGVRCVYKVQKRDQTSVENSEWGKLSSKAPSRKISWSRGEREKKTFSFAYSD